MTTSQAASSSVTVSATGPLVSALRWYLRVGGLLMALLALVAGLIFGTPYRLWQSKRLTSWWAWEPLSIRSGDE